MTNLVSDKVRDLADSLSPFPVHQPLESSMTAQATLVNGRPQRKQLSEQLDRLDSQVTPGWIVSTKSRRLCAASCSLVSAIWTRLYSSTVGEFF